MPLPQSIGTNSGTFTTTGSNIIISATALSTYYGSVVTSGYATIHTSPTKVHILGEYYEFSCYVSQYDMLNITLINVNGRNFYDEAIKNGLSLPNEIDEVVRKKLTMIERDSKINNVINDK